MTRAMQVVSTGIARAGYDGYESNWRTRKDKDEVRDTRNKETVGGNASMVRRRAMESEDGMKGV